MSSRSVSLKCSTSSTVRTSRRGVKTLFRKKRKHLLWITYQEDPESVAESTVMFELGKDVVVGTLDGIERGTGRRVLYADAEAAKFRREQKP